MLSVHEDWSSGARRSSWGSSKLLFAGPPCPPDVADGPIRTGLIFFIIGKGVILIVLCAAIRGHELEVVLQISRINPRQCECSWAWHFPTASRQFASGRHFRIPQHRRQCHLGMSGAVPDKLISGRGSPGSDGNRRPVRQAALDCFRQQHRLHLQCRARGESATNCSTRAC